MSNKFQGKRAPLAKLEVCFGVIGQQYENIQQLLRLKDQSILTANSIENSTLTPLNLICDEIKKIN